MPASTGMTTNIFTPHPRSNSIHSHIGCKAHFANKCGIFQGKNPAFGFLLRFDYNFMYISVIFILAFKPNNLRGALSMAEVTYPCYWQKKDNRGEWYWIYYAKNGEAIARSSESYKNRDDCTHGITLVKNSKDHKVFFTE